MGYRPVRGGVLEGRRDSGARDELVQTGRRMAVSRGPSRTRRFLPKTASVSAASSRAGFRRRVTSQSPTSSTPPRRPPRITKELRGVRRELTTWTQERESKGSSARRRSGSERGWGSRTDSGRGRTERSMAGRRAASAARLSPIVGAIRSPPGRPELPGDWGSGSTAVRQRHLVTSGAVGEPLPFKSEPRPVGALSRLHGWRCPARHGAPSEGSRRAPEHLAPAVGRSTHGPRSGGGIRRCAWGASGASAARLPSPHRRAVPGRGDEGGAEHAEQLGVGFGAQDGDGQRVGNGDRVDSRPASRAACQTEGAGSSRPHSHRKGLPGPEGCEARWECRRHDRGRDFSGS